MWIKWALGEAGLRTVAIALYKVIGGLAPTLFLSALSIAVIGTVQVAAAGLILLFRRINPLVSVRQITGSVAFGVGAFFGTILPIIAFSLGGTSPSTHSWRSLRLSQVRSSTCCFLASV